MTGVQTCALPIYPPLRFLRVFAQSADRLSLNPLQQKPLKAIEGCNALRPRRFAFPQPCQGCNRDVIPLLFDLQICNERAIFAAHLIHDRERRTASFLSCNRRLHSSDWRFCARSELSGTAGSTGIMAQTVLFQIGENRAGFGSGPLSCAASLSRFSATCYPSP